MSLTDGARAYNATTGNLKQLIVAVEENAAALPDVSAEKAIVVSAIADAEDAVRRQTFHGAQRGQATQDLKTSLARGVEAGVRLQNAVRFKLGAKDEKLMEFQLKPRRKRRAPATRQAAAPQTRKALAAALMAAQERIAALEERLKAQIEGDKAS